MAWLSRSSSSFSGLREKGQTRRVAWSSDLRSRPSGYPAPRASRGAAARPEVRDLLSPGEGDLMSRPCLMVTSQNQPLKNQPGLALGIGF
jgi:hypothetical protein